MLRRDHEAGLRDPLVERDAEIVALAQGLSAARDGVGSAIVVEGPAGEGKSSLLAVTADVGHEAGMRILQASGTELERAFPFGLAIQLFEPHLISTATDDWAELIAGAPGPTSGLLERRRSGAQHSPDAREYALIHGLFQLTCNLVSPASAGVSAPAADPRG